MNLKLVTTKSALYGIEGEYYTEQGQLLCVTLQHAFPDGKGGFVSKILPGRSYICKRGQGPINGLWKLECGMIIDTFQVMDVPAFQGARVTNILAAHPGNYNTDSNGCILVGDSIGVGCILDSRNAFKKFMDLQAGVNQFILVVE
jgi:uncharacterized protein DUF5675